MNPATKKPLLPPIQITPAILCQNEHLLYQGALQGMGIALLPIWMIEEDLALGRLIPIIEDYEKYDGPLYAVYPSRKNLSSKVSEFINFLMEEQRLK